MNQPVYSELVLLWMMMQFIMAIHTQPELPPPYQLIHRSISGSLIELICREGSTAESLPINEISMWLNRTSVNDLDLREREDVGRVVVYGCCGLRFNLTPQLEGNFTCGKRIDIANIKESLPKTLICK
jgi:hypothetical protein